MIAKLIKKKEGWYNLYNGEIGIGSTHEELQGYKLSIKNCQAIERGYDLDELAEECNNPDLSWENNYARKKFKAGFQKALELMGDKKFSEKDMRKAIIWAHDKSTEGVYLSRLPITDFIQSLQQTEWDVEIEMQRVKDETKIIGAVKGVKGSGSKITTYKSVPKLDADGCLILKRV